MYPGVPSSPTAGTAVSVCPHRQPGPSSFFSITAFTTVYPGAGLGPGPAAPTAAGFGAAAGVPGVPGVDGADDEVSLPDPEPAALAAAAAASESESDSVVMRESTSIPQQLAASPGHARVRRPRDLGTRRRRRQGPPPYDAAGIAGTLDSPRHPAARFARVPPRPAAPITREGAKARSERQGRKRLPPASGIAVEEGQGGPLRSGGRGQRAVGEEGAGEFGGFAGGDLQIWEGVDGPLALAWLGLEWRRGRDGRKGTGEDEVEERESGGNGGGKEILATSFLVSLGAVLPFRPRAWPVYPKCSPARASCCRCCRITRRQSASTWSCKPRLLAEVPSGLSVIARDPTCYEGWKPTRPVQLEY